MGENDIFDWNIGPIRKGGGLLFETWPPIDIYETQEKCIVLCEAAGMREDDFHINCLENLLVISGARQEQEKKEILTFHCYEINYGRIERQVYLPERARVDKIDITYQNGFLKLSMPFHEGGSLVGPPGDRPPDFFTNLRRVEEGMNMLFAELGLVMGWEPPANVYETKDALVIQCEIAGMQEDDFVITIQGNRLTLGGERAGLSCESRVSYHRMEIHSGPFAREFHIPAYVDTEKIDAAYHNGCLKIKLLKSGPSTNIPVE